MIMNARIELEIHITVGTHESIVSVPSPVIVAPTALVEAVHKNKQINFSLFFLSLPEYFCLFV
jgi:hypothetical protein